MNRFSQAVSQTQGGHYRSDVGVSGTYCIDNGSGNPGHRIGDTGAFAAIGAVFTERYDYRVAGKETELFGRIFCGSASA